MKAEAQQSHVPSTSDITSAAQIVRDIINVERLYAEANGPLSECLLDEIVAITRQAVELPWMIGETNGAVTIQHQDWRSAANITLADAWIELSEDATDDQSWIAAATASGPTRMGFELKFRPGLPHFPAIFATGSGSAKRSVELGFEAINDGEAIFLPVTIDREALAKAFEADNFAEALAPVTAAIGKVVAAKDELDRLIGLVRKRGNKVR